ncbi:MAG: hypothetical protein ACRC8Y_13105 [Chroococcales cyanobacterium]
MPPFGVFFWADRRFTVGNTLIMRVTVDSWTGQASSGRSLRFLPGLWGFLKSVFQLARSIAIP